MTSTKRH